MTAEVAVLNRHAIALATDSAVTLTHRDGEKVFNSVNKLFALQRFSPVGVMVYGEADFMQIPWEPLLKVYRSQRGATRLSTIANYADDLLSFVQKHPLTNDAATQEEAFALRATQFYLAFRNDVRRLMERAEFGDKTASNTDVTTLSHAATDDVLKFYELVAEKAGALDGFPGDVVTKRRKKVEEIIGAVFDEFPLTPARRRRLFEVFDATMKSRELRNSTGVVVAGYGDDEMFPALVSLRLDGVYDGSLRFVREVEQIDAKTSGLLIPFAQGDVVATFMDGVHPNLDTSLGAAMSKLMDQLPAAVSKRMTKLTKQQKAQMTRALKTVARETLTSFLTFTRDFKRRHHQPITEVLSHMPKEELAELAESLVHLTSTRRRIALETETVGGPIDVAVITKGDGFIWLKRKHYFRPELNPQFFARMLQEGKP